MSPLSVAQPTLEKFLIVPHMQKLDVFIFPIVI